MSSPCEINLPVRVKRRRPASPVAPAISPVLPCLMGQTEQATGSVCPFFKGRSDTLRPRRPLFRRDRHACGTPCSAPFERPLVLSKVRNRKHKIRQRILQRTIGLQWPEHSMCRFYFSTQNGNCNRFPHSFPFLCIFPNKTRCICHFSRDARDFPQRPCAGRALIV